MNAKRTKQHTEQASPTFRPDPRRIAAAMKGYEPDLPEKCQDETTLIDLLVDLRHWCDEYEFDFAECDRQAQEYYAEEVRENHQLARRLLADFKRWSGGLAPEECDDRQVADYIETALPKGAGWAIVAARLVSQSKKAGAK